MQLSSWLKGALSVTRARLPINMNPYLEEQYEAHPLVVRVIFPRVHIAEVVRYPWMRHFYPDL